MWHDNETTIDYLNFGVVADACASLLKRSGGEPISIGVSGGWGAGKSSLVKMIAERLIEPESKQSPNVDTNTDLINKNTYVIITFNPWLYQDFESARSAILQIIGDEVLRQAQKNPTLVQKAKELWQRINLLRLAQLGGEAAITITTGVPVGPLGQAISKAVGWLESAEKNPDSNANHGSDNATLELKAGGLLKQKEPLSLPNEIHAFREALENILEDLGVTLVVFVDDLDRCLPKTAISTLESIRLLLFIKRTAFVIAADNEFIRGAVKAHFEGTGITSDIATNYFDKLIQVPLHVPRLGVNETKAYLALLLLERETKAGIYSQVKFDDAKNKVSERLRKSWMGDTISSEFLSELAGGNTELQALMDLAEGLAPLMFKSISISANPRLIKRFLNIVFLREALAKPQGITLDIPSLAKWHLLERCNEDLANTVSSMVSSENDGEVASLLEAESNARNNSTLPEPFPDDSFVKEWLQLLPALGARDLRPLLHLSRDTATRDFGDDNMTPASRELRDTLKVATSANVELTKAIEKVDATQAELAMVKAWQSTVSTRTLRAKAEMIILIEPCKVFPILGKRAATILGAVSVKSIGPGIIPTLAIQPWATEVLKSWQGNPSLDSRAKKAITAALREEN